MAPATVRAALPILAAQGFVDVRPGRSARICDFKDSAEHAAVSLGVLMRGVVVLSIGAFSRTASAGAAETVKDAINAIAHPTDHDLRAVAIAGYERWASLCVNRTLGAVLAAKAGALAVASVTHPTGVPQPVTAVALHTLASAIEHRDPAAARWAVTRMHGLDTHRTRSCSASGEANPDLDSAR